MEGFQNVAVTRQDNQLMIHWQGENLGEVKVYQSATPDFTESTGWLVGSTEQSSYTAAVQPQERSYFLLVAQNGARIRVAERVIPIDGLVNFRDLGGYLTNDGYRTKWGKLLRSGGFTCELGHMSIDFRGPRCACGNRGCLETVCSTTALFREISRRTPLELHSQDTYGSESNRAAMEQVARAFSQGDPQVSAVVEDFAQALCSGIVSIVNLFAVQSVYIGGAVRLLGDSFILMMQHMLEVNYRIITNSRSIHSALFDDDLEASRKAAVMLTMERLFRRS